MLANERVRSLLGVAYRDGMAVAEQKAVSADRVTPGERSFLPTRNPFACALLLILFGLLGAPGDAGAAPDEALVREAELARKRGDRAGARRLLHKGYRQSQGPEILALLSLLLNEEGRTLAAADLARRYAALNRGELPEALRKELAPLQNGALPVHCELRISSDEGARGAVVLLDEEPVGVTDLKDPPLRVLPGNHSVRLVRDASEGKPLSLECPPRRRVDVVLSLSIEHAQTVATWDLMIVLDGELSPEARALFRAELGLKLADANVLVLPYDDEAVLPLVPSQAPQRSGCPELACLGPALDQVGAQWALRVGLPAESRDGTAAAAASNGSIELRDQRVFCNGFYQAQVPAEPGPMPSLVSTLVARTYETLYGPVRKRVASVLITSEPTAELELCDRKTGSTPFKRPLYYGRYRIHLVRPGYLSRTEEWDVDPLRADEEARLSVLLPRDPVVARRRTIRRGLGWGGLVLGGLTLAGGVSLLVLHGRPYDCDPAAPEICAFQFDTRTPGIALTAAGGAFVGVSVLMFGLAAREPK